MNTPVLGPIGKRMAERDAEHIREWNRQQDEIQHHRNRWWKSECAERDAIRSARTATWLAASGWLVAITLACVLVAR